MKTAVAISMYEGSIWKSSPRQLFETKFRSTRGGPSSFCFPIRDCEGNLESKD